METQIDQSIKIEQTARSTFICLSNNRTFVVAITSKTKRKLQETFRRHGLSNMFPTTTFATAVSLLIYYTGYTSIPAITIDDEYPGYEDFIRKSISLLLTDMGKEAPVIIIRRVGKNANAHIIGYQTYREKRQPDRVLTYGELRERALKNRPGT